MPLSRSFQKLFIDEDNKSEEWDNKLFEYADAEELQKLQQHLDSANELYYRNKLISTAINEFTIKNKSEEEKMRLLNNLKNEKFIKEVNVSKSSVLVKTEKGDILTYILSEAVPELKEEEPEIETENRKGKCHKKSIKISNSLGDIPNYIVTGYIYGYSDKSRYLHSWVEFNYNGEDMVIDYTLNALMNKDGYYLLQNAIPLNKISNKTLQDDLKKIKQFDKVCSINIKEYLVFRDEIMKDYEKNKTIFDEER